MHSVMPVLRRNRRTLYAALGVATISAAALIVVTSTASSTPESVVTASNAAALETPELTDVAAPPAPEGCSAAQLAERDRQGELLDAEREAEARVIATITDGSLGDKLGAIRQRADIILGRIDQIDARCTGDAPAAPAPAPVDEGEADGGTEPVDDPAEEPAEAPGEDGAAARELAPLALSCDDVDFTGVAAAAAERAATELENNETQLEARLAADFPRFANRVAREADPTRAAAEFTQLAENLANTLEARRGAILQRAGVDDAAEIAATCEVVPAEA
jgi:hypothetical protein